MSVKLRIKELKEKGKSYYLDIYHDGARHYEFLGINIVKSDSPEKKKEKLELANAIRSQREIELISKGTKYIPKHKKKVDFIAFYKEYLKTYNKKDVRMIRYSLEKFTDFIADSKKKTTRDGGVLSSDITPDLCEEFRDYLTSSKAKLNGETPKNYFARFKKVLRAAIKVGLFTESPASNVTFKNSGDDINKLTKQILTIDELKKIANTECGNNEVKKAFLFACYTGLGMAELRKLKWLNIDNNRLVTSREKTGIKVNIQLSESALSIIGPRKKANDFIFDLAITDQAISKNLKNWVKNSGIEKNISFYCGRHTYAVLLLMNGTNLKTTSEAMGQKGTQHTIKYLNFVNELKDNATSNLPNLF